MDSKKTLKKLRLLCLIPILVISGWELLICVIKDEALGFLLALGYLILVFPTAMGLYGIFSFKFTKQFIKPNLLLFEIILAYEWIRIIINIIMGTRLKLEFRYLLDFFIESLGLPIILTAISLAFSFISFFINKTRKQEQEVQKSDGISVEETVRAKSKLSKYITKPLIYFLLFLYPYIVVGILFVIKTLEFIEILMLLKWIYIVFMIPASIVIYGIISYNLTRSVIFPNLLLYICSTTIISYILRDIHLGVFILSMIITLVSLIPSLITMFTHKYSQKEIGNSTLKDQDTNNSDTSSD